MPLPNMDITGRTIVDVRSMTQREATREGWDLSRDPVPPAVIVLDNGTTLYASSDPERNNPGTICGSIKSRSKSGVFLFQL